MILRIRLHSMIVAAVMLFIAPGIGTGAMAQEAVRHTIDSKHPDQRRTFTVHLPASYATHPESAYPVLYLLDGENNLDYSTAVAAFLAQSRRIPELITIALHAGVTRGADYLPVDSNAEAETQGRADLFLDYLEEELIPFVEATYRSAPLRLISGHSVGGIFVTYAMISRPDLFQGYFAQSPYFTESIGGPLLDRAEAAFSERGAPDAFYYMNIGVEPDLISNFQRMRAILETGASDSFSWHAQREDRQSHMTTRLMGHYDALDRFFGETWPISDADLVAGGGDALLAHIDGLSQQYGYAVVYDERAFQQTIQQALGQQDVAQAQRVSQRYVDQHGTSPIAHFLQANAFVMGGAREDALGAVEVAIALYEANPDKRVEALYGAMKQMQAGLGGGK